MLADGQHNVLRCLASNRLGGLIGQVNAQHGGTYLRVLLGHDLILQGRRAARFDGVGIGGVCAAHSQRQAGRIGKYQTANDLFRCIDLGVIDNSQAQLGLFACHQAGHLGIVHIELIALHHHSHGRSVIPVDNGDLGGEAALRGGAVLEISGLELDSLVARGGKGRHGKCIVQILDLATGPVAEILTVIGGLHYEGELVQRGRHHGGNRYAGQRAAHVDHGDTHGNGLVGRTGRHGIGTVHIGAGHLQAAEGSGHAGHIAVVGYSHISGDLEGHILGNGGAVHGILTPHSGVDLKRYGIAALAGKLADFELVPHLGGGVIGHILQMLHIAGINQLKGPVGHAGVSGDIRIDVDVAQHVLLAGQVFLVHCQRQHDLHHLAGNAFGRLGAGIHQDQGVGITGDDLDVGIGLFVLDGNTTAGAAIILVI